MNKLILLSCIFLLGFSSCDKQIIEDLESSLIGTWYFSEVRQKTHAAFDSYQSIFSYYDGDQMTFNPDKTVVYREQNGDVLNGEWDIRTVNSTDSSGDSYTQHLISIVLTNANGTDLVQYVWETQSTIYNNLTVHETTSDYIYCYNLER